MKNIGLYFGSFNPVHIGHLIVAEYFASRHFDEVWFVVSPQNPLKDPSVLANADSRLEMTRLATSLNPKLRVSDIEFSLGYPSYTFETLRVLSARQTDVQFSLILGEDIKATFHLWREYLWILSHHQIYFFPRHHLQNEQPLIAWDEYGAITVDCPRIEISSTYIRQLLFEGLSVKYLVPESVEGYLREHRLYK